PTKRLLATGVFIGALALLLLATAHAAVRQERSRVEGIVLPDKVYDRQLLSFAASQVVEGVVVSVQTERGDLLQRTPAGTYGVSLWPPDCPQARSCWVARAVSGEPAQPRCAPEGCGRSK